MDFNKYLLNDVDKSIKELKNKGYIIKEIIYLNDPPGIPRVVRIKETNTGFLELLVCYHNDKIDY